MRCESSSDPALFADGRVDLDRARAFHDALGADALIAAVDTRDGRVVTRGWTQSEAISPLDAMAALEPYVGGFLYTDVEREGLLGGFNVDSAAVLKLATARHLIVAGGIRDRAEEDALDALGIDAVVGMAIYRGLIDATSAR